MKLDRAFYDRPTLRVARDLLGAVVVHVAPDNGLERRARIVETEAYIGGRDLACHASKGLTPRNRAMVHTPDSAWPDAWPT
jgi:DNA-3-methyladenine glycosylase